MTQYLKSMHRILTLSVCLIPAGCSNSVEEGQPQPVAGMPASIPGPATPIVNLGPTTSIFLGLTTTKPEDWAPAILENAM